VRVHVGGRIVPRGHCLILTPRGDDRDDDEVRFAATGVDGTCRVRGLMPGTWRYEVYGRFLFQDMHRFLPTIVMKGEPDRISRGEVTIAADTVTPLELDLSPAALSAPGTIRGRIDGPATRGRVYRVRASGGASQTEDVVGGGTFQFSNLAPGFWSVVVSEIENQDEQIVYQRTLNLAPGAEEVMDLEFDEVAFDVRVADARTGLGIAGAWVSASGALGGGGSRADSTDADGRTRVVVMQPGHYTLWVHHEDYGSTEQDIDVPPSGEVRVALDPGVPCAGRVEFEDPQGQTDREWYLMVSTDGRSFRNSVQVDPKDPRFVIHGLPAGDYRALLFSPAANANRQISFRLPPQGDTNLVLRFE